MSNIDVNNSPLPPGGNTKFFLPMYSWTPMKFWSTFRGTQGSVTKLMSTFEEIHQIRTETIAINDLELLVGEELLPSLVKDSVKSVRNDQLNRVFRC